MATICESTRLVRAIARSRKQIEIVPIVYDGTIAECIRQCRLLKGTNYVGIVTEEPPAIDVWGGRGKNLDSMQWRLRVTCAER